jgi:hypothetical protein
MRMTVQMKLGRGMSFGYSDFGLAEFVIQMG